MVDSHIVALLLSARCRTGVICAPVRPMEEPATRMVAHYYDRSQMLRHRPTVVGSIRLTGNICNNVAWKDSQVQFLPGALHLYQL